MASAASRRWTWRRGLLAAATLLLLGAAAVALADQWSEVRTAVDDLRPPWLVGATLLAIASIAPSAAAWHTLVRGLGGSVPATSAWAVFCAGQLGKYLPGGVWTVVAQAEVGRHHGASRATAGSASLILMVVTLGTGVLVGVATLPLVGSSSAVVTYWWLAPVLVLTVIAVHPSTIAFALRRAASVLRRPLDVDRLPRRALTEAVVLVFVSWILLGLQLYCVARSLGLDGDHLVVRSIGGWALAWSAGFVVVFAPAGIGVREVALVVALGSLEPAGSVVALAVLSRLVLTLADVLWGAWGTILLGARRRASVRPASTTPVPGAPPAD